MFPPNFFNHPTRWAWSVAPHLFGVLSLFGGAYALLHGRHIRVEILYERFGSRLKLLSHTLTMIYFLLFIGLLVWQGYEMAEMSIKSREVIRGIIHFPVYPYYKVTCRQIVLVIGMLVIIFGGIAIPTEAAGVGATGALFCCIINRTINWNMILESCLEKTEKIVG